MCIRDSSKCDRPAAHLRGCKARANATAVDQGDRWSSFSTVFGRSARAPCRRPRPVSDGRDRARRWRCG
eukprot:9950025-Alexandrium_andersonii.AAC.1